MTNDSAYENVPTYTVGNQQGIDSLSRGERSFEPPAAGEVLVRTRAAALNYRDIMILEGRYGARKPTDRIPIGDGAGDVVAVGSQVTNVSVGDRVTAPHFTLWNDGAYDPAIFAGDLGNTADGWLSEMIRLPGAACVKLQDSMTYESAAALGAAAITAWRVLEVLGNIKAGDTVLTLGTGGVSIMALQLAKMNGATVAITSSSDEKLQLARELGADVTVNYRTEPAWDKAVVDQTGGADIVVETVGLATLDQSIDACAPNARIGYLGALGGLPKELPNLGGAILKNAVIQGITSGSRRMLDDMLRACTVNGLEPHVDRVFAFDEASEALNYLAKGRHVGKIVLRGNA